MSRRQDDRFAETDDRYDGYQVYGRHYEKVGKADGLFVDGGGRPEYIGIKTGLLGSRWLLVPMTLVRVNDQRHLIEVDSDKDNIAEGPTFSDPTDITPEFEDQVYAHFGITRGYPRPEEDDRLSSTGEPDLDLEYGERAGSSPEARPVLDPAHEPVDHEREDTGIRERGRKSGPETVSDDEVRMPVLEEKLVVRKRPVQKEEIRIRKEVVEEEEVFEEDVRREEVEVEDDTDRRP